MNEAALFAARANKRVVSMVEFEKARQDLDGCRASFSVDDDEEQKESTAYHEGGHMIIGHLMPEHDPVHKVTIVPRGQSVRCCFLLTRR